ncbi:MAG: hypothetical protein JW955_13065 [Sedimentisphaerales bacterium]|nr:hypothetical protein [Sedimentisphaerales bacterium]
MTTRAFSEDAVPADFAFYVGPAPGGFWIYDVMFYGGDYVPTAVRK